MGFLLLILLIIGAVVGGKWVYQKFLTPCGCHDKALT